MISINIENRLKEITTVNTDYGELWSTWELIY